MSVRGGRPDSAPWDPIRDLSALRERMNRLLESVLRRGDFSQDGVAWTPAVDLREDREGFVLTAEIPGVRREDVSVRIDGGLLVLEGKRTFDDEGRAADHLRVERSYGPFSRSFPLTAPIDETKVTARLRLGVLEVFLPRASAGRGRSVTVRIA